MLNIEKKQLALNEGSYSVARFEHDGRLHLFAASEGHRPCYSFTPDGVLEDVLWTGPGGVMNMEQLPGHCSFFCVQQFFGPNNAKKARLAYFEHDGSNWNETIICHLPFLHRIGLLHSNDELYLIACTVKSSHHYQDDWTAPGVVYMAKIDQDYPYSLILEPLVTGLFYNHGLFVKDCGTYSIAYIASKEGVIRLTPPGAENETWSWKTVLDRATSDICMADLDGDGEDEMIAIHPFHGDELAVYRLEDEKYVPAYEMDKKLPFLHAMCPGRIHGKSCVFLGYRGGEAELLSLYYDAGERTYKMDVIDKKGGPSNVLYYQYNGEDRLIAANREKHDVAMYLLR